MTVLAPAADEAPATAIARIEAAARRVGTPNGAGEMVWRSWGSGPPLVLLHGGHGSWRHWIRTIPAFAADYTVWAPDLPGLGDSGDFDGRVPEGVAAIVAQGLAAVLPAGRPFDLVGFSFGALVGGHVAALLGRMLRSLTLVGPGALGLPRRTVELQKWRGDMPEEQLRDIHRGNLQRLMIAQPGNVDELAVLIQMQNTSRARVHSRSAATSDSLAMALRRSCPQRLNAIWGECDAVAYPYLTGRKAFFHDLRPDAGFHLLPQAGHWAAYEAAGPFNALLRGLLNGAAPAR